MKDFENLITDYLSDICQMKKIRSSRFKYNFSKIYIIGGEKIDRNNKEILIKKLYTNLEETFGEVPFEILEKWIVKNI